MNQTIMEHLWRRLESGTSRRGRTKIGHPFRMVVGLSFEMQQKAATKLLPNALSRFT